jgi:PAS domain S-box-containing protein
MLSGHKKESEARTAGLEAGADDYLVRPVANRELLARIRAGLRIHQTEEDLRRERDLLDRMMETSPVGITLVNREGQLTFANARAEEILGLSRDALTQRTYNAPEWRITDYEGGPFPQEELPFNQVMAQGEPVYDVRHAIEHPDGHRSLLSINSAPLRDASGQITGMVSIIEDVTERVQEERRRHERLKEELRALAGLASSDQTAITASMFGATPLQETSPHLFDDLCQTYSDLLDRALTARLYKVSVEISDALRMIARRLGARQANPRDVIDLHSAALQAKIENANPRKAKVYVEEGHLVVLELMGYLVSYYQNYVVKEVSKHRDAVTQISETEGDNYE